MRDYTAALSKIPLAITSVFLAACGDYDPAADEGEWALGEPELGAIRQESICAEVNGCAANGRRLGGRLAETPPA